MQNTQTQGAFCSDSIKLLQEHLKRCDWWEPKRPHTGSENRFILLVTLYCGKSAFGFASYDVNTCTTWIK